LELKSKPCKKSAEAGSKLRKMLGEILQTNILPPSAESKNKPGKKPEEAGGKVSEMSGCLRTTQCYNREDHILHSHHCENLKSNVPLYKTINVPYANV
jgi:hypothetical protein